jgi:hypothetical protein
MMQREALERALDYAGRTHEWPDVVAMLLDGRAQFWQRGAGVIVTELQDAPRRRVVNYWLVAGRLPDVLQMQPEIDTWAVQQGATHAIARGRAGWTRVLPRYGWKAVAIDFAKELRR